MDEKPMIRHPSETLSQFQHGNVNVKKGHLSMALVFHNVTKTLIYDDITCKRVLPKTFTHDTRTTLDIFDDTISTYRVNQTNISSGFTSQVKQKLSNWNWT